MANVFLNITANAACIFTYHQMLTSCFICMLCLYKDNNCFSTDNVSVVCNFAATRYLFGVQLGFKPSFKWKLILAFV